MNSSYEQITALQYRLKAAERQLHALKSGAKYAAMENEKKQLMRYYEQLIKKLKREKEELHRLIIRIRNNWFEVFEDMQKEFDAEKAKLQKLIRKLEERALHAEQKNDELEEKAAQQRQELYEVKTQLEEEQGKNRKLTAQLNRNFENSSIPSSKSLKKKKISNSREKSGRKPGGQPGHKGHRRKKLTPTSEPILLKPSQEIVDDPDFKKTGKTITKQLIGMRVLVDVTEYHADIYYNSKTGERYHAPFPKGVVNDVNYAGSIKAFLYLLNNDCCTSIDKSRKFLSDLTDGKLQISKGMINSLSKKFAENSDAKYRKLCADLLLSPVMHTDCTNAKMNGKSVYVYVCASPEGYAVYYAREKKGHEGVKGTLVEDYQGILVHDHEATFYNYGSGHQECLAHVLRYLKDSMQNEPKLTWNREIYTVLQEMLHYRNSLPPDKGTDLEVVAAYEARYRKALQKAKEEYEYEPPSKYYREGYNLYLRMEKYMSNHLLFLHDLRVPATNNEAERDLRKFKRKQAQAVTFRSQESIDDLCIGMSMLLMMRQKEMNIFSKVSQIMG